MSVLGDIFKENKKILLLSLGLLVAAFGALLVTQNGYYQGSDTLKADKETYDAPDQVMEDGVDYQVILKTSFGNITIDLFEDETPVTVNSFLFLASERFFNDLTFHRVIQDFVIQAGDPLGTGKGGPGYQFKDEITDREYEAYSVGMANAGAGTNGSQFFIVSSGISQSNLDNLTGSYTIFGEVIDGFSVVDSIDRVETDTDDKPLNDVTIESVQILEN